MYSFVAGRLWNASPITDESVADAACQTFLAFTGVHEPFFAAVGYESYFCQYGRHARIAQYGEVGRFHAPALPSSFHILFVR